MTQDALARAAGVSRAYLSRLENAHWIPSGDKRFIDRLEAIRSAAQADGSNVVAADGADGAEVREKKWSRGRELNPRPTDYESVALPLSYPGGSGETAQPRR